MTFGIAPPQSEMNETRNESRRLHTSCGTAPDISLESIRNSASEDSFWKFDGIDADRLFLCKCMSLKDIMTAIEWV